MLKRMISFAAVAGLVLAMGGSAQAVIIVADDSVWPENVADDVFTLTIPDVGTVPYLQNGEIYGTDWIWSGDFWGGDQGTYTVTLTLKGGETAPNLGKLGIWLSDSDYGGDGARNTASVEFEVNGSSVGTVLRANFLPPSDGGTAQTNNTGEKYVFAELNGSWSEVSRIDFLLTAAGFESPSVGEAVAVVPEPATLALIGLGGIGVLLRRRRT